MPWDGKDGIRRQRGVPVRGLVALNQAKENSICRISAMEAKSVLFNQAIIPVWDDKALDGMMPLISRLSTDLPFYRLDCLPDAAAAEQSLYCLAGPGADNVYLSGLRLRTFCTFSSAKLVHFKLLSDIARNRRYRALWCNIGKQNAPNRGHRTR